MIKERNYCSFDSESHKFIVGDYSVLTNLILFPKWNQDKRKTCDVTSDFPSLFFMLLLFTNIFKYYHKNVFSYVFFISTLTIR